MVLVVLKTKQFFKMFVHYVVIFREKTDAEKASIEASEKRGSHGEGSTSGSLSNSTNDLPRPYAIVQIVGDDESSSHRTLILPPEGEADRSPTEDRGSLVETLLVEKKPEKKLKEEVERKPEEKRVKVVSRYKLNRKKVLSKEDLTRERKCASDSGVSGDTKLVLSREDLTRELDEVLAGVQSDLASLSDTGTPKAKPSDRPDLVIDLPVTMTPVRPGRSNSTGSERVSPELTLADTFASSNQSTLKKGSSTSSCSGLSTNSVPVSPTDISVFGEDGGNGNKNINASRLSTRDLASQFERQSTTPPKKGSSLSSITREKTPDRFLDQDNKPGVRIKPAVLKKPQLSPEMMRRSPFATRRAQFEQSPPPEKPPIRTSDV